MIRDWREGGETRRYNPRSLPMPQPHNSPREYRLPGHSFPAAALLLALLLPSSLLAAGETPATQQEPLASEHVEEVEVPAQRGGDPSAPAGMASTVVDPEKEPVLSDGIAGLAATVAGVTENGQGGLFQSISIRGLARLRILQLVDSVRITSERRAGAAVSFLDPLLISLHWTHCVVPLRRRMVRAPWVVFWKCCPATFKALFSPAVS